MRTLDLAQAPGRDTVSSRVKAFLELPDVSLAGRLRGKTQQAYPKDREAPLRENGRHWRHYLGSCKSRRGEEQGESIAF